MQCKWTVWLFGMWRITQYVGMVVLSYLIFINLQDSQTVYMNIRNITYTPINHINLWQVVMLWRVCVYITYSIKTDLRL